MLGIHRKSFDWSSMDPFDSAAALASAIRKRERRSRGSGRGRPGACGACQRWRRLDPHTLFRLRRSGAEAQLRPGSPVGGGLGARDG